VVTLKSGKSVSLHLLLKSIPASEGMSCPQLFQQAEPNSGAQVTIVSFQDQDREVITRQSTLTDEIRQVLADNQVHNVFLSEADGIWFGSVTKSKTGSLKLSSGSKEDVQYSSHIDSILHSPPKKRVLNLPKWGGGLPQRTIPNHTPSPKPSNLLTTSLNPSVASDLDNKFQSIRIEINAQCEQNVHFDARISSLEVSTRSIDSKIDQVLAHLAPPTSPTHKMQRITTTRDESMSYPGLDVSSFTNGDNISL